jgi:hypothetical protein
MRNISYRSGDMSLRLYDMDTDHLIDKTDSKRVKRK